VQRPERGRRKGKTATCEFVNFRTFPRLLRKEKEGKETHGKWLYVEEKKKDKKLGTMSLSGDCLGFQTDMTGKKKKGGRGGGGALAGGEGSRMNPR